MTASIAHRGPDGVGHFIADDAHLVLGHRRLSIIDLTETGAQPMSSRSGRWTVVLNGEIYNHRDLRRDLHGAGITFRGTSDTETLIEAVDRWGVDPAIRRMEGMFAMALWDAARRQLWLVRDRLGEKPLYWTSDGTRLAFASELRSLRAVPGLELAIDERSAASVLRWGFVPHPQTIYRGVQQLPPGTMLRADLTRGELHTEILTWWSFPEVTRQPRRPHGDVSLQSAASELDDLLFRSVSQRLESDVPIASFLSGGIDSTLTAAMAQRALGSRQLSTFTVRLPGSDIDETIEAERIASWLGTNHITLELGTTEALELVTRMSQIWDEPLADPSMLPTALVCRAAARHATVCLGGDGGDEVLAGYNRHVYGASIDRLAGSLPHRLRSGLGFLGRGRLPMLAERFAAHLPNDQIPHLADKLRKAASLVAGDDDLWSSLVGIWPASALGPEHYAPEPLGQFDSLAPIDRLVAADTAVVLPDQMLVKVDRASMRYGLEVRSPFLDTQLLEWAWSLPIDLRTHHGSGKVVARELARRLLPPGVSSRRKRGFDPPLASWLRHELREWASGLLSESRVVQMGLIDRAHLRETWVRHMRADSNEEYRLWAVLMLEAWLREPGHAS